MLAQSWKMELIPTINDWQIKMINYAELARITGRLRDQDDQKFHENWNKYLTYIRDKYRTSMTLAGLEQL